jgi:hypothetical protein
VVESRFWLHHACTTLHHAIFRLRTTHTTLEQQKSCPLARTGLQAGVNFHHDPDIYSSVDRSEKSTTFLLLAKI